MMDVSSWLWLSVAAGAVAVLYGIVSMLSILKLPAGNARMQEIAAAIQAIVICLICGFGYFSFKAVLVKLQAIEIIDARIEQFDRETKKARKVVPGGMTEE